MITYMFDSLKQKTIKTEGETIQALKDRTIGIA